MDGEAEYLLGDLQEMFIEEAREHISRIEPDLLAMEKELENPEPELINRMFRELHSIKGSAGFFGLEYISKLSHVMENILSLIRDGKLKPDRQLLDALLQGTDKLRLMVDNASVDQSVDISSELDTLQKFLPQPAQGKSGKERLSPKKGKSLETPVKTANKNRAAVLSKLKDFRISRGHLEHAFNHGYYFYSVQVFLYKDLRDKAKTFRGYLKMMQSAGEVIDAFFDASGVKGLDDCLDTDIPVKFLFASVLEPGLISTALELPDDQAQVVSKDECEAHAAVVEEKAKPVHSPLPQEPVLNPASSTPAPAAASEMPRDKQPAGGRSEETSLRVHVSLLDDLMNMAGELVLARNQLLRMTSEAAQSIPGLSGVLQNINLITSDLQEKIMHTRMQPVGVVLNKFPRIIRDLARKLNKDIVLEISGNEVEVDKSIIENLSDPLTHLIRNAADHGIESPEERTATGKPPAGKVQVLAYHEAGQVNIDIIDDGKGINIERVKAKAVTKGMATETDVKRMGDRDILQFIFAPGFSLAEKLSDVSGRGVGMDVVKTNIEKLGGNVLLESREGEGTRISLRLPLTLAIIPSLIISTKGQRFALPQVALVELVRLKKGDVNRKIEMVHGSPVLRLRKKLLPLIPLCAVLRMDGRDTVPSEAKVSGEPENTGTKGTAAEALFGRGRCQAASKKDVIRILVLRLNDSQFGLIVDEIHDTEEIVVKSLPRFFKNCPCYAGTTIMGDGCVALILDVAGIAAKAELKFGSIDQSERIQDEAEHRIQELREKQRLLLFENAPGETFGINLDLIMRVEKIQPGIIEKIGDKEFIKYQGGMLRVIRLEDFLPVSRAEVERDTICLILPKTLDRPVGIIAPRIIDSIETDINLDQDSIKAKGLIGSAVIRDRIVMLLDVFGLTGLAEPEQDLQDSYAGAGRSRLLLVEDTPFFREVEKKYLREAGYEVCTANDGLEALDLLEKGKFDLVVTDICMPRLDGFGLLKKMKEDKRFEKIPILALTSLSSDEDRERGIQAGFNDYETKLNSARLLKKAEELLKISA